MEPKNREKLLLMVTGVAVAFWLLNLLVITPLIDSWHSRSAEIDKLTKELADGAALIRRGPVIRDRWDFMRGNALNSDPTVAERQMFTAFDRWAKSGSVTQGSFRPQVQESDANYLTVDCRSDVSGSINNVGDFLRAMSRDPVANKLDSFVLTSKDDNGRQLTLDMSLSGLVLTDSVSSLPPATADLTPPAKDTNAVPGKELDAFQLITRNNIFDQSRRFLGDTAEIAPVRTPRPDIFTACGIGLDGAVGTVFFEGKGVRSSHTYKVGDTINDMRITKITLDTVTLTNASSNTFNLAVGKSLRREPNGPWQLSGDIAAAAEPETISNTTASPPPSSGGGMDAILERLRKRREQEDK
jgi:hypothetical protein